ncbi:YhdP family protein [Albidovulum sp.]|uniref:YhdP family protein n=1 Tax=Albidovulum sp. TaxID=1872424 RepID=UPI003D7CC449
MNEVKAKPVRRHLRWPARALIFALVAVLVFGGVVLALGLSGRAISAPQWVVEEIEARANTGLAGRATVRIGAVEAVVEAGFVPRVRLKDVALFSPRGLRLATLERLGASFWPRPLLDGIVQPRSLRLVGARIALRRTADGSFDISLPEADVAPDTALSPGQILDEIDRAFGLPALRGIERVDATGLDIRFDDLRSGQSWRISDGRMSLTQHSARLAYDVAFAVAGAGGDPAQVELSFSTEKSNSEAGIIARITGVPAQDVAAQSPALSWLGALDAPISGVLRTGIDRNGEVRVMQAELDIGAGAVRPNPGVAPLPFDRARVAMSYAPARAELAFSEIVIESPTLNASGDAQAWLQGSSDGFPDSMTVQLRLGHLSGNPDGLFAAPLTFDDGLMDFKLTLKPFGVTLGQLSLFDQGRRVTLSGRAEVGAEGWVVAVDAEMERLAARRLVELWPLKFAAKTRAWLGENLLAGEAFDAHGALRLRAGQAPVFSLGFRFRDASVRFMKSMPVIRDGAGYGLLDNFTFTLVAERGTVEAPQGGQIALDGSVMRVEDTRVKPAIGQFDLKTSGSIAATLSLLDQPPLEVMRKAGRPIDLAQGRAVGETRLVLPFRKGLTIADVDYRVRAQLLDLRSEAIVPGHDLAAERLAVTADKTGVAISGAGDLSGAGFDVTWRQAAGAQGTSAVAGSVDLSRSFLDAFGLKLPDGMFSGSGKGEIALDLVRGEPTRYRLTSGLAGIAMEIPSLGWAKPASAQGRLDVSGVLGQPASVDALELDAAGLSLSGSVQLSPEGAFQGASFPAVSIGGWFDGAVVLTGRGANQPPAIAVTSGSADLTRVSLGDASRSGARSGPISVALDQIRVSEGIRLTRFRGDFTDEGGLSGRFTGLVNGEAPVTGAMVPMGGKSGFRVQSQDAGATMRAAGVFTKARGGTLDLVLQPEGGKGRYAGTVEIETVRVVDAPALAGLLDAISVVGLIDQLNGPGILFNHASGKFRMTPDAVEISEGAATGASMGISAAGLYRSDTKEIDIQGTISPVYLLNGIGRIVSKKGEGLFGFNYAMTGPASAPRIKVNPLSILTPGMFREIFRSAPPRIEE